MNNKDNIDFLAFAEAPIPMLVLNADPSAFTIVRANKAYLSLTNTKEADLLGKSLFETFPANLKIAKDKDPLKDSLKKVVATMATQKLVNHKYDMNSTGIERCWDIENTPIIEDGKLKYIIHYPLEIDDNKIALNAESQRLKNIIDTSKLGVWEWNIKTGEFNINERWAEIAGYTLEELSPISIDTWHKLVHPDDLGLSDNALKECFSRTNDFYLVECRMMHKNGHIVWIKDTGSVIKWTEDGKPLIMAGTHTDITSQRLTDGLLVSSEKRFKTLVEYSTDAVAILTEEGEASYVSPSITNVLGYKEEEVLQLNLFEILHPDDIDGVVKKLNEALKNPGIPIKGHISRIKHKDKSWRWIEATITNMLHDPNINGIIDNFRDITEKVLYEQKIIKSEQRFKALVQEGSDLTAIVKNDGTYLYVSPNYKPNLGYTALDLIGKNAFDYFHPDDVAQLKKEFSPLQLDNRAKSSPYRFKHQNGEWRWLQIVGTNLSENQSVNGIVINTIDITELVLAQKELEKSYERFELVNKATNDAIYDWDVLADEFYWGDGFYTTFGYEKGDEVFRLENWANLMHPVDCAKHKQSWQAFFNDPKRQKWMNEFRFKKQDESYAYVEEIGNILRDKKGRPVRMIGALRDITKTKRAENQSHIQNQISSFFSRGDGLTHSLEQLLQYLTNYGGLKTGEVWLINSDENCINLLATHSTNADSALFYKLSKKIKRVKKGEGLPGVIWQKEKAEIWDKIDSNKKFLRYEAAQKSGLKSSFGFPLFNNKKIVGVVVFFCSNPETDPSLIENYLPLQDFLGIEIKRKQQEEQMFTLFHSAPEIIAIADPNGKFAKVNKAFCDLLGYTEKEITSKPFAYFIHPEDVNKTITEYEETITGEKNASNFINRYRTEKGEYKWISWSSSDVFGEDGYVFAYGRDITEIKKLQNLLDTASRLARVGSWEIDLINKCVYWSNVTKEIREAEADFVPTLEIGVSYFKDGYDKDTITRCINECIENFTPWDEELQIYTFKGNLKWIRTIGRPEVINGKCVRIEGSFQDIHQQKMAQLSLESSLKTLENYQFALDQSAIIAITDEKGIITLVNDNFTKIAKYDRKELIGNSHRIINSGYHSAEFFNKLWRTISAGHVWRGEIKNKAKDGSFYWVDTTIVPFLDKSGKPKQYLAIRFDITQRKKAEAELKQSHERFKKVTEATNDAIWDWDIIRGSLYWGHGYKTLFGYDPQKEKPSFDSWSRKIHPAEKETVLNSLENIYSNKSINNWQNEYRFEKSDGNYAHVKDRGVVVRNHEGTPIRMIGAITDITEQKRYEFRLKEMNDMLQQHAHDLSISNAELEQFAFVASHDLQEPLRMITSFLSQLEKKYGTTLDKKGKQYISFAVDGAKRMRQIILDLLDFSRIGKYEDENEIVDLNEVITEVTLLLRKKIEEANAKLNIATLPKMECHKSTVVRIFQNLIENSLKYSKPDISPIISINAEELTNHWRFSISDNGIGINADYYDKIFIIFQRLHAKDEYAGTGMGLSIVKKIIENFGGEIWVESTEGQGSTFFFTLPKSRS
ncbi:MAG: PAS domain S-box protein [Flavobacteriales bacterium]